MSGVAKYLMVKVDPHAVQNPRSAFPERLINLRFDVGEKVIDDTGKSMNAMKAPPDILRHVLQ
jgi:hypothetical protein